MTNKQQQAQIRKELILEFSNFLIGETLPLSICSAITGEIIIPKNRNITWTMIQKLVKNDIYIDPNLSPIHRKLYQAILGSGLKTMQTNA